MLTTTLISITILIYGLLVAINIIKHGEASKGPWTVDSGVCVDYEIEQVPIKNRHRKNADKTETNTETNEEDFTCLFTPIYEFEIIHKKKKWKQRVKLDTKQKTIPIVGRYQDVSVQWNHKHEIIKAKLTDETFEMYAEYIHKNVEYITTMCTLIAIILGAHYGIQKLLEIEAVSEIAVKIEDIIKMIVEVYKPVD